MLDFKLLLFEANLTHLSQPPSTDDRGKHHQTKASPKDSTVASHQSIRRGLVSIIRILRDAYRDNSKSCESNGRSELGDRVEYGTSKTLGLRTEGIGND